MQEANKERQQLKRAKVDVDALLEEKTKAVEELQGKNKRIMAESKKAQVERWVEGWRQR